MARRAARKARRNQLEDDEPTSSPSPILSPSLSIELRIHDLSSLSMSTRVPLLICSIGNPPPQYADTLHSAGHTVLHTLPYLMLGNRTGFTDFARDRRIGPAGLIAYARTGGTTLSGFSARHGSAADPLLGEEGAPAPGRDWTLWQSGALMNVSGKGVAEAWRGWRQAVARSPNGSAELAARARLVVLHDELERPLGKVIVRRGRDSLRGHNGLKSVAAALGGTDFIRIGIGIDRPASRDPAAVASYVLAKMDGRQKKAISNAAGSVLTELINIWEEEG